MNIYLFFKQYYIALWKNLAKYLENKWITPNQASILSLFIIFPMFYLIWAYVDNLLYFTILMFFAINIKLILNAIDGIIARNKNINTKLGMFLNVGTDIIPDMFILYLILNKLGVDNIFIYQILVVVFVYLLFEFFIIWKYNKQNIYLWWKESRTFFYILILIVFYFKLPVEILLYYYIFILVLHNILFFMKEKNGYKKP
jgi:phosphatidylglycerophosphate synthase